MVQRTLSDIVCPGCQRTFRPISAKTQFCSIKCRDSVRPIRTAEYWREYKKQWHKRKRIEAGCRPRCGFNQPIGTKWTNWYGYILVKVGPGSKGWKYEHRVVMEGLLGRELRPGETVHHINGIKSVNAPDNLELWGKLRQPNGIRLSDYHCPGCRCARWFGKHH